MKVPKVNYQSTPIRILNIEKLTGIDLYNSAPNVEIYRSPDCLNMIRDEVGKVRKRTGYHQVASYTGAINGKHFYKDTYLLHVGTNLYVGDSTTPIYTTMANARSKSWQMTKKLFILDGKELLVYGEFSGTYQIKKVSDIAYVPKIIIGRAPTGGGTALEPINLIQTKWQEGFYGTSTDKVYQLSFGNLDSTPVTVKKLNANGTYTDWVEKTNFTVDRTTGKVTFITVPGVTPITGKDNVLITASRVIDGYKDKVNKCDISTLYGVNGAADRLFISGNPTYVNYAWYSQMNDPTYFGDTWFVVLGSDNSPIIGFTVTSDRLCAHKKSGDDGRNVVMLSGTLSDNVAAFPIVSTLQGVGAIGKYTFDYLNNEPLFLTSLGIYAITPSDITGERYTQNRSFYVNKQLIEETNLENAIGCTYKDLYLLAINGKVYVLDGLQKTRDNNAPQSEFLYECYLWDNLNIYTMWIEDNVLYFGTSDGKINAFYTDTKDVNNYNDNGTTINAYWTMPDFTGKIFYKNKTFKRFAIQLASATATGVTVYAVTKSISEEIYSSKGEARTFSWSHFQWSKFTWSTDTTPHTLTTKIKIKKVDKVSYKFSNKENNESFGIYYIAFEYTEGGNYKG